MASLSFAQKIVMNNGKVKVENELFCLYGEVGKNSYNSKGGVLLLKDIFFTSIDYKDTIYLEAKVLASFDYYLWAYYRMSFLPINEEINILYHSERMEFILKDFVWFRVFKEGKFNNQGA